MSEDQFAAFRPLYVNSHKLYHEIMAAHPNYMLDIGANVGRVTAAHAHQCGRIDAFEPVPDRYDIAKRLEEVYSNVRVYNVAMSDAVGISKNQNVFQAWVLLPHGTDLPAIGFPGCGRAADYPEWSKPFDMETTTIDEWCQHDMPDFIKLDVDGYEVRVLKGALKTLIKKPCPIYFEYSYLPRLFGDSVEEMADIIYNLGYRAWSVDGAYVAPNAADFLKYFPHNTSYDVMLVHSSQR